ncbi:hypothetical protein SLA2020_488590 [Shorea laevis]
MEAEIPRFECDSGGEILVGWNFKEEKKAEENATFQCIPQGMRCEDLATGSGRLAQKRRRYYDNNPAHDLTN